MQVRLIDANALMKKICGHECGCNPEDCGGMESETVVCNFHAYVSEQPTIEPEVRHGKLLEGKTFNDQHCSVCGQRFRDDISFILPSNENGFPMPKRCPECGCYWDGGADNGGN